MCKMGISKITFEDRETQPIVHYHELDKCAQFQVVVLARQALLKHSVRIE